MSSQILVIIPTYNERESLPIAIDRVLTHTPHVNILVVDDNSPDGTGQIADDIASQSSQVHVLHRAEKNGLGGAYLAGFAWGLERNFDVLVEMDADGSHRAEDLPKLLAKISDADVVLGSRWVPEGTVVNWPKHREALSRGGNLYTRIMLGMPVSDATGGFRAYRASALRSMNLAAVESQGYCFQVDLAWRAVRAGLNIVEVPITFVERELGQSKMDQKIVVEALWRVTQWGVKYRLGLGRR